MITAWLKATEINTRKNKTLIYKLHKMGARAVIIFLVFFFPILAWVGYEVECWPKNSFDNMEDTLCQFVRESPSYSEKQIYGIPLCLLAKLARAIGQPVATLSYMPIKHIRPDMCQGPKVTVQVFLGYYISLIILYQTVILLSAPQ